MEVRVKAYAVLKDRIGVGEVPLEVKEGATVRDAIKLLSAKYGSDIEKFFLSPKGEILDEVFISHNGVMVDRADKPLTPGDLILLIPPFGGG